MTRDEFEARYRLLQTALRSGGVITHHALSPEGAVVMVHVFDGEPDEVAALEARADLAEAAGDARILERLQVDDHPVLVTRFILDFEGLDPWLPPLGSAPVPAATPEGTTTPRDDEPGEFTRAFESPASPSAVEPGDPPAEAPPASVGEAPPPLGAPPPEVPPTPDAPGEFTRMFRAADLEDDEGEAAPPAAAAPPVGSPPPPAPDAPGEFTRLFRAEDVAAESASEGAGGGEDTPEHASPADAPPADAPGEFTRQFGAFTAPPAPAGPAVPQSPASTDPGAPPPSAPERSAPSPKEADGPGEFTREFGALPGVGSGGGGRTGQGGSEPGEFTREFGAVEPPAAGPPPPEPDQPAESDQPGEFTRQFSSAPPLPEPGAPRPGRSGSDVPEPDFGGGAGRPGAGDAPPPEPRYGGEAPRYAPPEGAVPEPDYGAGGPAPFPAQELPEPRYARDAALPPMRPPTPAPGGGTEEPLYGGGEDYADRLYDLPEVGPPPVPSPGPPPAAPTGPGEYTRIIQGVQLPPAEAPAEAPPAAAPAPPEDKKPSTALFVGLLVVVLLAAIAAIVVLILLNRPEAAAEATSALPG